MKVVVKEFIALIVILSCLGLLLLAVLSAMTAPAEAVEQDKMLHASVAYSATVTSVALLQKAGLAKLPAQLAASFLVMSAGVVKESMDTHADSGDILANGVGTAAGCVFTIVF